MAWRLKTSGNTFAVSNGKHLPEVFDECASSIFRIQHSYFGWQTMRIEAAQSSATPVTSSVGTANARRTQNFESPINAARIILKCRRNPPPDSRTQNFKSPINAARINLKCRRNPTPDSPPTTGKLPLLISFQFWKMFEQITAKMFSHFSMTRPRLPIRGLSAL